ncbi:MAG: GntR family transcriptional regulator [Longispora sp.]|nr:GntR family transcriptional regulator [Longispora sp. (in: high G+C Gram-positive bacteria)]
MAVTPRYREIADELRDVILGEQEFLGVQLVGGAKLPTEPEIGAHFECARSVIRQALQSLALEGLIETRGRAGTYVRRLKVLEHSAHSEHPDRKGTSDSWHAEVLSSGRKPTQDFSFKIIPAPSGIAKRLQIPKDDLVVVRSCFRYVDSVPWSEQASYYPYDIARAAGVADPHDIEEGAVRRLAAHGFREVGWADEVSCRPATEDEERAFEIPKSMSVLVYNRVGWTEERPVRLTREILPADRNIILYETGDLSAKYGANGAKPIKRQAPPSRHPRPLAVHNLPKSENTPSEVSREMASEVVPSSAPAIPPRDAK